MIRAYLVDASPYIFRAFHSLPSSIVDPAGRQIHAIHGFCGFLLRLLSEERPTHLVVAFDGSLTTSFRNTIYPEYKAHREPPPRELEDQVEDCRELASALGAHVLIDSELEADDLIGSVAGGLAATGAGAVIVSSDKDLAQLVTDTVELYDFAKDRRYGPAEVRRAFGVPPRQIADLLALAGDPVDNIPGVPGVGRKTAVRLLESFPHLEALYERLPEVEELPLRGAKAVRRRLEQGESRARLSKRLAVIVTDGPVEPDPDALRYRGPGWARLEDLAERLGMTSLVGRARQLESDALSG